MIRIRRGVVIGQMTAAARCGRTRELSSDVAQGAGNGGVRARQVKSRGRVVECRAQPGRGRVALTAILRKAGRDVIRICCSGEILYVTAIAIDRRALEASVHMASGAIDGRMCTRERKMSELRVIKPHGEPLIHVVAGFARRREPGRDVVDRAGLLKILEVTARALRAQAHVSADGRTRVTVIASGRGMRTQQREAIPVVLHGTVVDPPALDRMAPFALCTELPLMQIRVTVGALRTRVGKDLGYVARVARHRAMHAAQRILRIAIVIEFGTGT